MDTAKLEIFFSTQWTKTIKKYKTSLEQGDRKVIDEYGSWDDVKERVLDGAALSLTVIVPALGHLSTFADFFKTKLGPDLDTSFMWGTLACLLQLAAKDPQRLSNIPRRVKSLAHRAETFNDYCNEVQIVSNSIKEACFDMQSCFLDFFTNSILDIHRAAQSPKRGGHSHSRSHSQEEKTPFELIEQRYGTINSDLDETLTRVKEKIGEINAPSSINASTVAPKAPCLMLPHTETSRFFDRVDIFEKLDQVLDPAAGTPFQSVALYGLGGVGKSMIVSTYVQRKFDKKVYDVILWIHGEKLSSLRQSFTDIAMRLKLDGAQPQTHDENLLLVRDWFQSTDYRWLAVYDNVESAELLTPYWPSSSHGTAIITSRNRSLAFAPASSRLEIASWDARTGSEFLLFLLQESIGHEREAESESAFALSERLSGHALALSLMASLIHNREISIQEFMTTYMNDPHGAHVANRLTALFVYPFKSLAKNSKLLLGVMSYLMPDNIPQGLFEADANRKVCEGLEFCTNTSVLSDALEELIKLALINRDRDTRVLSIHRLVQLQFKCFLDSEQRKRSFHSAVALVRTIFPKEDAAKGQMYHEWETCNRYVQHVINLKDCFTEEMKLSKDLQPQRQFCELLARCQRFLYEANILQDLDGMCDVNMTAVETLEDGPQKNDLRATIMSHQANLFESRGDAARAIQLNKEVYDMRLKEDPMKLELLGYVSNNLGYCHNTANDHETALKWFQKSRYWWTALSDDRSDTYSCPPFILANTARCMVYLNDLEAAKNLLDISMAKLNLAKPLNWAMLAYGYFILGTLQRREKNFELAEAHFIEAQNSWLKGEQARLHPFNAGCMYKIGVCCLDQGKVEAAIKHIRDSIEITKFHERIMPVEHARNRFKLSEALLQDELDDSQREAHTLQNELEIFMKKRPGVVAYNTEDMYDNSIPIFWR